MAINANQLKSYVIEPTLKYLDLYSDASVNLLLGTCAQESHMGTYIHQLGNGPACGIYQMEPFTHKDLWKNFLGGKLNLSSKIRSLMSDCDKADQDKALITNLAYATAMTRVFYLRIKESLPQANDIEGMAKYWKLYYNTVKGKGTEHEFISNYERYVLNR